MSTQPADKSEHKSRALRPIAAAPTRPLALPDSVRQGTGFDVQSISPAFLWWVFQQWWKIGIPAGLALAGIAAAAVLYMHVPKFEAKALLRIQDSNPTIAYSSGAESQRYIHTQLVILTSEVVLGPVMALPKIASINELKNAPDPIAKMRKSLMVKSRGNSELYDVTYVSSEPSDAAVVVNEVVKEYINYSIREGSERASEVIAILEEERGFREMRVKQLRKELVELSEDATGTDPYRGSTSALKLSLNPMGELFRSLTEMEAKREELNANRQYLAKDSDKTIDRWEASGLLDWEIDNHPEFNRRQQAVADIEGQIEQFKADAMRVQKNPQWESSPTYQTLQKELKQRQLQLEEFKPKLKERLIAGRRVQLKLDREEEIAATEEKLVRLDGRIESLSKRFAEQLVERKAGEGKNVELEFKRANLAREEKVFDMIASRKLALQTELRAPKRVDLLIEAARPSIPIEPVPYKLLVMASAVALCAPFGAALLKEILVRRVSDVDQLAQESRLRVLGEIAELPVRHVAVSPRKMAGRLQREAHVFAESINSLRTNLSLAEDLRDVQVLAVTSPCSGESKSSIAVSLAMSIANATSKPTLIIDADMRSPDVASMLKTRSQPGLFEILADGCQLEDAIQHVGDSSLYVIPAGRATRSTHHLVKVEEMKKLLDRLRTKFSTIVIDTPPILGASESIVLVKSADAALLCSLSGVSRVRQVRMAVDRLEHAGVNVAGAVLSGSSVSRYAYRYGYYPIENASGN